MTVSRQCWGIGALVFALFTSGCATPPPRYTPESVAIPRTPPADLLSAPPLQDSVELPAVPVVSGSFPLTRDGALLTSLLNNKSIDVARLNPEIAQTAIPMARAEFDPEILATVSYGRDERMIGRLLSNRGTTVSSTSGSSTSTSSSTTTSQIATKATTAESLLQAATQLQNLETTPTVSKAESAQGALTLQQKFPTGTVLFLTGSAIGADSNLADSDHLGVLTVGVEQPLLEGAGLAPNLVSLRQARNRAAQSEHLFRATVIEVLARVELTYWDLVLAEEVYGIREFGERLAQEQLRYNEERFSAGKVIEGDVMAARAELASRHADLGSARARLREHNISLVRLLNPASEKQWDITFAPVDPPEVVQTEHSADASEGLALVYRPELADARLEIATSDLETLRARNRLFPRLDLSASYASSSQGDGSGGYTHHLDEFDYDSVRVGLEFHTPILNRGEKAEYRRSQLITEQNERYLSDLEQETAAQVRRAIVAVEETWERLKSSKEAVTSRTEQLRVAQGRFEAGKVTNLDLLIVQRDFLDARIDEVTSRVRHIQALTALYTAEGTLLERRGVALAAEDSTEDATSSLSPVVVKGGQQ